MTKEQAIDKFLAGELVALGEYRMSKAEILNWRDKVTGRPMSGPALRHTVEFGGMSVAVNERVPDGMKLEDIRVPLTKGDSVVCHLSELTAQKGVFSARGEKLEGSCGKRTGV